MDAPISPDDEARIWQWNAALPAAPDKCLHHVFADQRHASPAAPAIDSWDGALTYRELDDLSTRLAVDLRARGAGAGEVVPICFEKSLWVVVGMLAVAKAGAAFATLDPAMPAERLRLAIRTVQPRVMLVGRPLRDAFDGLGLDLVADVPERCRMPTPPTAATLPPGAPADLAYVLFTSGSTGVPKVVLHGHRAAAANMLHATGYGPGARVLQFASQAFGASVWEIFKTLGNGGCLVVPPSRDRLGDIANFITQKRITRTVFTPSLLNLLKPADVGCLQILTVGGEPVSDQLIQTWAPHVRLMEAFGMTEGVAMETQIDREGKKRRAGQTLVGATWIVDSDDADKLAPIGHVGELLIESPALSIGYLDNPDANAHAFIGQPLWARSRGSGRAVRLFRTGDLARYIEDGVVQIVGRKDSRVKLYGQRFELGDVEQAMIKALPAGVSAAAELVTPAGGSPMLVAFVHGATSDFSTVVSQLRVQLAPILPDYMVPRGFVALEERPVNTSGKLDRKKLREMASHCSTAELVAHGSQEIKTPPVTDMEKTMHRMWSEVLNLPPSALGLEDDFFSIGGSSLHCIKLLSAARCEGVSLEIEDIFRARTLQSMSATAKQGTQPAKDVGTHQSYCIADITTDILESNVSHVLEATDWQAWSVYSGLLKTRGWHDYMKFDFTGPLDAKHLETACSELIKNHSILRSVFMVRERTTYQVVLTPDAYPFRFTVCDGHPDQPLVELSQAIIDADLKRKALLGDALVEFWLAKAAGAQRSQLIMRISHAQYDAVSVSHLWNALERAYRDVEYPTPIPFTSYADQMAAEVVSGQAEEFWREHMDGAQTSDIIPHHRLEYLQVVESAAVGSVSAPDLRAHGLTTATAVLACWGLVLSQLCQQPDAVFGNIVSGRHLNISGAEDIIGPCMDVLPVRTRVAAESTVLDFLNSVQERYMRTLSVGYMGHRKLIEKCTSWPHWARFSTIVNYISLEEGPTPFTDTHGQTAGLKCELNIFEPAHDKADLWLHAVTAPTSNLVNFELRYSSRVFPEAWVKSVLDHFCAIFESLPASLESTISCTLPQFSGSSPLSVSNILPATSGSIPSNDTETSSCSVVKSLVHSAWELVFGEKFESRVEDFSNHTPFYSVWGDPIGAAALAKIFSQNGHEVATEDVLDHPSMIEQVRLLQKK